MHGWMDGFVEPVLPCNQKHIHILLIGHNHMKGWEAEWSNWQNIVFEINDVEVFLVDQKQWTVRILHDWYGCYMIRLD